MSDFKNGRGVTRTEPSVCPHSVLQMPRAARKLAELCKVLMSHKKLVLYAEASNLPNTSPVRAPVRSWSPPSPRLRHGPQAARTAAGIEAERVNRRDGYRFSLCSWNAAVSAGS